MGFIIVPQKKRIKIKVPNTERNRRARQEHREWLAENGLLNLKPRDTSGTNEFRHLRVPNRTGVPCSDKIPVNGGVKQEPQIYSGERRLVGIATMHKSNQVPIFADDDDKSGRKAATEITLMKGNK